MTSPTHIHDFMLITFHQCVMSLKELQHISTLLQTQEEPDVFPHTHKQQMFHALHEATTVLWGLEIKWLYHLYAHWLSVHPIT